MLMVDYRTVIYSICSGLGIPVYDYWITNAAFPYCITQTVQSIDNNAKNLEYGEYIFDVHIFDKYNGKTSVINCAEALKAALYEAAVPDVNRSFSYLVVNDREPDVAHAVCTIRFKY